MWSFGFDGEIIDNQPGLRADGRRWRISGGKVWKRAGTGFRRKRWIVETRRQHILIQIQNMRRKWSSSCDQWISRTGPEGRARMSDRTPSSPAEREKTNFDQRPGLQSFFMIERDLCDQLSTVLPLSIQIHTDFFTAQFQRWPQQCDTEQREDWNVGKWRRESEELRHALFCETQVAYLG